MTKYALLALLLASSALSQTFTNGQSAACATYYYPSSHSVYCVAAPMYDAGGQAMGSLSMYALVDNQTGQLQYGSWMNTGHGEQYFSFGWQTGNVFSGTFAGGVIYAEVLGTKRVCGYRNVCRTVTVIQGGSGELR